MLKPTLAALAAAAALACLPAHAATTLLDTYGADGLANGLSWSLFDSISSGGDTAQSLAVRFEVLDATTLTGFQTSISGFGDYSLRIVADSGDQPLGAVLYATTLSNPVANAVRGGLGIALNPGSYWLATVVTPSSSGSWQGGGNDVSQPWAFSFNAINGNWLATGPGDAPAARLFTSPVPEPASWALMLGGALLLAGLGRRRA